MANFYYFLFQHPVHVQVHFNFSCFLSIEIKLKKGVVKMCLLTS